MKYKSLLFVLMPIIALVLSCSKEKSKTADMPAFPSCKALPLLTSKIWYPDTILIEPASAFNQLTIQEQNLYRSGGWWKALQWRFNSDNCRVEQLSPNWDYSSNKWGLINNDKDIIRLYASSNTSFTDTLFSFTVTATQFSHRRKRIFYDEVYVYK
jgi:hypothetical protein